MLVKQIDVAGIKYNVEIVEEFPNIPERIGEVVYDKATIYIRNGMSKERMEQVLVHELLHAILYEAGYDEQDEELVNRASIVLYQALKHNDDIFGRRSGVADDH